MNVWSSLRLEFILKFRIQEDQKAGAGAQMWYRGLPEVQRDLKHTWDCGQAQPLLDPRCCSWASGSPGTEHNSAILYIAVNSGTSLRMQ
jgi:hypothetical protein